MTGPAPATKCTCQTWRVLIILVTGTSEWICPKHGRHRETPSEAKAAYLAALEADR